MEQEVKGLMGGRFKAITRVVCVAVLALSLGLATSASVIAADFPSISPTTAQYNLDDPAEVMTTITWGVATGVVAVTDVEGHALTQGLGNHYIVLVKHLIILDNYLKNKLKDIGQTVELIVQFNVGAATFTIAATGTQPSIAPTTAQYNLDSPADVRTTITWGSATSIVSVKDDGQTLTGMQFTATDTELIIRSGAYLAGKLKDIGNNVVLTVNFNRGNNVTFTITAIGTQPSISPTTAQYDIDSPADVRTTITWGIATSVSSIVDNGGLTLTGTQYTVAGTNLTIRNTQYLAGKLKDIGDSVVLTIRFNLGNNATLTVTATGVNGAISPQAKDYDLDNPADVSTTITWNTATSVTSIVDGTGHNLTGTEYTLTPIVGGVSANLTVRNSTYLAGKLTDIGDKVVLTIRFDLGADAAFTITAVGIQPRVSPQTKEYDLDNPTNAVTTITWGTATSIVSIVDGDQYTLIKGADYTVTPINADSATLTILAEPYLEGKHMDIGDSIVLTINFNIGADATFTITSMGIQPVISPVAVDYDVINQNDVSTIITWGSASSVASIVDDSRYLLAAGMQYIVTSINPKSANLTILSSTYLASKLRMFGKKLVLTIGFDVGRDATLTITVPEVCFIATAAYGTPMAQEIQVLREFRDEYLLTNSPGRGLVDVYYRVSPPIAEFITEHPGLKPAVRAGLLPVVAMSSVAVSATPVEKMVMIGLLALVSAAVAVWATRRRGRGPEYTRG